MVFLQGAAKARGPAAACLNLVEAGHVQLFLSDEILREVHDVLTRPKLQKKFPALTNDRVRDFLNRLRATASVVGDPPKVISFERDPKDEKYLNLAAATAPAYLVSRDNDLLDLQKEETQGRDAIAKWCGQTQFVDPVAFLKIMDGLMSAAAANPDQ